MAMIVDHRAHFAIENPANKRITAVQRALLHQYRRHRTAAAIQFGFDDRATGKLVRIGFELQDVRLKQQHFQKVRNAFMGLRGHWGKHRIAAPIFRGQSHTRTVPRFDFFQIGVGPVDLVYRDDDRHFGSARVIDRFDGLGHDAIVRGHDQHDDIGHFRAARAHGGESFMARRIEKRHAAAVHLDVIRADMLGNPAMLLGGDVGAANGVEKAKSCRDQRGP